MSLTIGSKVYPTDARTMMPATEAERAADSYGIPTAERERWIREYEEEMADAERDHNDMMRHGFSL